MKTFKTYCLANNDKLQSGDEIMYKGSIHKIVSVRRCGQKILQSITTETHHLNPSAEIFTTDLSRI